MLTLAAGTPNVFVSFSSMDVSNDADCRLTARADNIKRGSFDLVVGTWAGNFQCSRIYSKLDKTPKFGDVQ